MHRIHQLTLLTLKLCLTPYVSHSQRGAPDSNLPSLSPTVPQRSIFTSGPKQTMFVVFHVELSRDLLSSSAKLHRSSNDSGIGLIFAPCHLYTEYQGTPCNPQSTHQQGAPSPQSRAPRHLKQPLLSSPMQYQQFPECRQRTHTTKAAAQDTRVQDDVGSRRGISPGKPASIFRAYRQPAEEQWTDRTQAPRFLHHRRYAREHSGRPSQTSSPHWAPDTHGYIEAEPRPGNPLKRQPNRPSSTSKFKLSEPTKLRATPVIAEFSEASPQWYAACPEMQLASWATLIFEHNPRFKQQQRIFAGKARCHPRHEAKERKLSASEKRISSFRTKRSKEIASPFTTARARQGSYVFSQSSRSSTRFSENAKQIASSDHNEETSHPGRPYPAQVQGSSQWKAAPHFRRTSPDQVLHVQHFTTKRDVTPLLTTINREARPATAEVTDE